MRQFFGIFAVTLSLSLVISTFANGDEARGYFSTRIAKSPDGVTQVTLAINTAEFPQAPAEELSRALKHDQTTTKFRVNWRAAALGSRHNSTALYDRRNHTFKVFGIGGHELLGQEKSHSLYRGVTDEILHTLAQSSDFFGNLPKYGAVLSSHEVTPAQGSDRQSVPDQRRVTLTGSVENHRSDSHFIMRTLSGDTCSVTTHWGQQLPIRTNDKVRVYGDIVSGTLYANNVRILEAGSEPASQCLTLTASVLGPYGRGFNVRTADGSEYLIVARWGQVLPVKAGEYVRIYGDERGGILYVYNLRSLNLRSN